jgi:predicted ATP-grasp superfamily ATP-dependent carboligase
VALRGILLKVIVYEHVSGGGYAQQNLPSGVLAEGFGMLRCAVADFSAAGHEVTVLLDARLSKLNPPLKASCTVPLFYAGEPQRFLSNLAKINDALYVIAPETGQTLPSLVKAAEETGTLSLNGKWEAVARVADKTILYRHLQKNGFPTPKTLTLNTSGNATNIGQAVKRELAYPVVFKPADGAGCSGISIIKHEGQIERAIAKIKTESANPHFIAQEYLNGIPVSVSLLSNGEKAAVLSLNKQQITLASTEEPSSYDGGCTPFDHPLRQKAFVLAQKVVESFSGLRGYVGVDLILGKDTLFVVDVNARLTTSYVGLRKAVNFNAAQAIVDAVVDGKLPETQNHGAVCYSKIQTPNLTVEAYQKAAALDTVVSPPFPLTPNADASALVMGQGDSLEEAQLRLEEAKKQLQDIIC